MATSFEQKVANIELKLHDLLDKPIKGLRVEIKIADKTYHKLTTDAKGMLKFSIQKGEDVTVSVKHWTKDSMKDVAKFFSGLPNMKIKITSPKFVKELQTLVDAAQKGKYWRGTYQVKKGDTLSEIAKQYGVGVDLLKAINKLDSDLLKTGQYLKVPPVPNRPSGGNGNITPPTPPKTNPDTNGNSAPVTPINQGPAPVIFPLRVRPLNDPSGKYFKYLWTAALNSNTASQAVFGRNRSGGKRKHAARDLYVENYTEIVAVADGVVLKKDWFYMQTDQVSVHHKTSDGREFVVRYGELDPSSIKVKVGQVLKQGDLIGKSGILKKKDGTPAAILRGGKNVSMLHFEYFTGSGGLDRADNLTTNGNIYVRRSDLADPLNILQEGYKATFLDAVPAQQPTGDRIPIAQLNLSEKGKDFIKDYEKLRLDYYNDALNYCTVGWGHLTGNKSSCQSQGIQVGKAITLEEAKKIFNNDVVGHEEYVRKAIQVPLYQHEFDALCSLAFNVGDVGKIAPTLCKKINARDYAGGAKEFLDITNGGMKGLVKRRKQEYDMYTTNTYNSAH